MATNWGRSWVIITGASRGFGAALCEVIAPKMSSGSTLVGMARGEEGLHETKAIVARVNKDVKFIPVKMDLESACKNDIMSVLRDSMMSDGAIDRVMLVHNVGSIGDLKFMRNLGDEKLVRQYFDLNVSSVIILNSVFLSLMSQLHKQPKEIDVINISSLCALEPFKSWALYCTGKAARDMAFKVLAKEESNIRVLSYAPGPLDNDMQAMARENTEDEALRLVIVELKETNKLIPCIKSAERFLQVLENNRFKSGDHVDYYSDI